MFYKNKNHYNSFIMMNLQILTYAIVLFLSCVQIGFGVWEAITLSKNNPNTMDFTPNMTEAYAFIMTKCILNLLIGSIAFIIGLFKMCVVCGGEDPDKKEESNKNNILQLIGFGVNCWGIKLFDDYIKYNVDFGAYDQIIVAEFILFVSIIGLIILFCCGACCCICLTQPDSYDNLANNKQQPKTRSVKIQPPNGSTQPINTQSINIQRAIETVKSPTSSTQSTALNNYTDIVVSNV